MKSEIVTDQSTASVSRFSLAIHSGSGRIALISATLVLIAVIGIRGIHKGEFDYNVDEGQHAATGQFIASLLHDLPVTHPVRYTYAYYVHYPALSGVLHWPPLFYLAEGTMFRIFGGSVVVGRVTILAFALLAFYCWFCFVENALGGWAAASATLALAFVPPVLLFTKTVMLEMPALALCIATAYFWTEYLQKERPRDAYYFALCGSAAMLTKQNSIYLALFCALSLAFTGKWRLLIRRATWIALGLVVLLIGSFYGAVYTLHWGSIAKDLGESSLSGGERSVFYLRALPGQLGMPLLALSILGMVLAWRTPHRFHAKVMCAWILSCYLTFTCIGHMEARYVINWLPAFTFIAVLPLTLGGEHARPFKIAYSSVILVVLGFLTASAWRYERPYIAGYRSIAEQVKAKADRGVILVDSDVAANFVFFVRALDPAKHFVVLRKALYVDDIKKQNGSIEFVHDADGVRKVLAENGVRFVCLSQRATEGYPYHSQVLLRQVLSQSREYHLVGDIPLTTNERWRKGEKLLLYENPQRKPPITGMLRIPMMTLKEDILVPWSDLDVH